MTRHLPPLTVELWTKVRDQFSALTDLVQSEQASALDHLERTEPAVARHVAAMLRASKIESPLDASVGTLLEGMLSPNIADLSRARFGPYTLVKPLGRGGMGMVYLGRRDDLDSLAAIKVLPHAWIDPARRHQFVEEMRILADLSHDSIAGLLHAGQLDDGTPWFAMQYVEGEPITQWVWRHQLTTGDILRLFDRLCAAVQHAHGHPIAHRDLKPSNVLVTAAGEVKLLDFGIAKRLRDLHATETRSRTVTREVTVEYAAPEQLHGRPVGVRVDVYALGIILFELLAGRRPYEISDLAPADAEAAIRGAYPPRVGRVPRGRHDDTTDGGAYRGAAARALHTDERRDIEALLSKASAPDPGDRYVSVEEMRRDISSFLERKPLIARKAGWRYRARKFAYRHWRGLSVAIVLVVAGATGVVLHNRSLRSARDVAIAEAARTTRLRQFLEDLFQGGPQSSGPLDSIRVATIVANGIRGARALTTDPAIQVELLGTLGLMSQRMGDTARADSVFLLAIDRSTALYGSDDAETLRARVRRAGLLAQVGKADSAERELRAVDTLARRYASARHPVAAEADFALGTFLRDRSKFPASIAYLERTIEEERARDSTSREYQSALRELGITLATSGNVTRADSLFARALPLARRLFGPRHPDVAFLLASLGSTASRRGLLIDAERYQREAIAITSAWYGDDHYLTGAAYNGLAQTLIRAKRYDEAIAAAQKTINAFARSPDEGPDAPNTNIARSTLGTALSRRGDHSAALREFEIAADGLRRRSGEQGRNTIVVAGNVGMELLFLGRVDSAVALLRRELAIAISAFGEDNAIVGDLRVNVGGALVRQRRFGEAIPMIVAGLRILDAKLGRRADTGRSGRRSLLAAYVATGDSTSAARIRAELADSLGTPTPPIKK